MKRCSECGFSNNSDNANSCEKCGSPLSTSQVSMNILKSKILKGYYCKDCDYLYTNGNNYCQKCNKELPFVAFLKRYATERFIVTLCFVALFSFIGFLITYKAFWGLIGGLIAIVPITIAAGVSERMGYKIGFFSPEYIKLDNYPISTYNKFFSNKRIVDEIKRIALIYAFGILAVFILSCLTTIIFMVAVNF